MAEQAELQKPPCVIQNHFKPKETQIWGLLSPVTFYFQLYSYTRGEKSRIFLFGCRNPWVICSLAFASHMEMCQKQKDGKGSKLARSPWDLGRSRGEQLSGSPSMHSPSHSQESGHQDRRSVVHFTLQREQNLQARNILKRVPVMCPWRKRKDQRNCKDGMNPAQLTVAVCVPQALQKTKAGKRCQAIQGSLGLSLSLPLRPPAPPRFLPMPKFSREHPRATPPAAEMANSVSLALEIQRHAASRANKGPLQEPVGERRKVWVEGGDYAPKRHGRWTHPFSRVEMVLEGVSLRRDNMFSLPLITSPAQPYWYDSQPG